MTKTIFLIFMNNDLIKVFEEYKTIREMMSVLKQKYNMPFKTHIQLFLRKYNSYKMKENKYIVEYVNKTDFFAKELVIAKNVIPKYTQVLTVINNLLSS